MPDVTPDDDNDGISVVRFPTTETGRFYGYHEAVMEEGECGLGVVYDDDPRPNVIANGRWFTTLRAEQLLAIEKAARYVSLVYLDRDGNVCGLDKLADALRPAAPGTPKK